MAIDLDAFTTPQVWRIARRSRSEELAVALQAVAADDVDTLRLLRAPGVWICVGDRAPQMTAKAAASTGAVRVDLSGAYAMWRIRGDWLDLIAHGSALDPRDERFAARGVAWTRFVQFDVAVVRLARDAGAVLGARSTSQDLDAALRRARRHAEILG